MKTNDPSSTQAVTLFYDGEHDPIVTAKGDYEIAQEIIRIAEEHHIPIHQDAALTELLAKLDLGESIPQQLYIAVATIIAFAYMLNDKKP